MPDPTAHADDMKSPAEYTPPPVKDNDTLPFLWWLNPWNTVLALLYKVDHLKATSRGEQASRIDAEVRMYKAMENAHRLSKENAGLNEARKADEASYAHVCEQRDAAREDAAKAVTSLDRALDDRSSLLFAIEREVKRIEGYPALENSIDLVKWAVDEVIELRDYLATAKDGLDNMANRLNEVRRERDAARDSLTVAKEHMATVDAQMHREQLDHAATLGYVRKIEKSKGIDLKDELAAEKQAVRNLRKHLAQTDRLLRKEQAKVNKLERAQRKPMWEDKTTGWTLTHGNHEDSPGMTRKERIAWLGGHAHLAPIHAPQTFRHGVPLKTKAKRKPKAKKKGGAK